MRTSAYQQTRATKLSTWIMVVAVIVTPGALHAQEDRDEARKHFDQGVELYKQGEVRRAIEEFETAYRLKPHFAVLYNLGQAHAALGNSVEALRMLRRYLAEASGRVDAARTSQIEATIALHERRVGTLTLRADAPGATCEVDGQPTDCNEAHLLLPVGKHVVVARRLGHETQISTVDLRSAETTILAIAPVAVATPLPVAWMTIECQVPNLTLEVDGQLRGKTPFAEPLPVASGRRQIRMSRIGYSPTETERELAPGRIEVLRCDNEPKVPLSDSEGGLLRLGRLGPGTRLYIDGQAFREQRLPVGVHRLDILQEGFFPSSRIVSILAGQETRLDVALTPTPEYRASYQAAANFERTMAYVSGAAGVTAGVVAFGLLVYNSKRYEQWASNRDRLAYDVAQGHVDGSFGARLALLNQEQARIVHTDDAAVVLACLGGTMLATAAGLFIWGKDPNRFASISAW